MEVQNCVKHYDHTQYTIHDFSIIEASTKFTDTARIFKTINLKLLVIHFIMSSLLFVPLLYSQ